MASFKSLSTSIPRESASLIFSSITHSVVSFIVFVLFSCTLFSSFGFSLII
nr:MAG TPA: hypothetical protein [Caudoviricetes sp.]